MIFSVLKAKVIQLSISKTYICGLNVMIIWEIFIICLNCSFSRVLHL